MKIQGAETHEAVACFLMGRENVIPDMFRRFLERLDAQEQQKHHMMRIYLERHIDLDEDEHAPMGRELMRTICGTDSAKWAAAIKITRHSLRMRRLLWDGVLREIDRERSRRRSNVPLVPRQVSQTLDV